MDCIAGLMAVPETDDRVNWVKSCWRDDRLVVVAVDVVVGIEEPVCNGDIKLRARLYSNKYKCQSKPSLHHKLLNIIDYLVEAFGVCEEGLMS
jgi:hypothetical protein